MKIFIMRHGEAEGLTDLNLQFDAQRVLTKHGITQVSKVASWLQQQADIDSILVSPYARTLQTAQIIYHSHNGKPSIMKVEELVPSGSAQNVHDLLDGLLAENDNQNILIVSHMPLVSYLVPQLCGTTETPIFQTAAIAVIHYDKAKMQGQLTDLISPESLD